MNNKRQTNFNPFEQNCAVIKDFFKKPIVLIVAIIQALFGACFVISFALNHFLMTAFKFRPSFFTDLVSIALYIVMVVGYIIVYTQSKSRDSLTSPLQGFRVLIAATIAKLVLSIASLLLFIESLNEITQQIHELLDGFWLTQTLAGIIHILVYIIIAIQCVVMTFFVVCYIIQLRFFNNIKKNLTSISLAYKGAMVFAVFNIILAFMVAVFALGNLSDVLTNNDNIGIRALMPILTMIFGTMLFVANAVMALGYRKHIKKATTTYKTPEQDKPLHIPVAQNATFVPAPASPYKTYADLHGQPKARCPYCKQDVFTDNIFCDNCGRKIK